LKKYFITKKYLSKYHYFFIKPSEQLVQRSATMTDEINTQ